MKIKPSILLIALFLTNCANTKILHLKTSEALPSKGSKLTIVKNDSPSFAEVTYGKMLLSMLILPVGIAMIKHSGNQIIKQNNIEDPAFQMSSNLALKLKSNFNLEIIFDDEVLKSNSLSEIVKKYQNKTDYVLDVKTFDWSLFYAQFDVEKYHLRYISEMKLIDVKNAKIIAQGYCSAVSEEKYYYAEAINNDAQNIKNSLKNIAEFCEDKFSKEVLF